MPELIRGSDFVAISRAKRLRRVTVARAVVRALEPLEPRQLLTGTDPVISEFVASNQLGLLDDYNTRQDWIEIYNPSSSPLNLGGWHLTDSASNPGKSTFPTGTSVPGGGYLV